MCSHETSAKCHGSLRPTTHPGGACMVLQSLDDFSITQAVKFVFPTSNSGAEYEVVLLVLRLAKGLSVIN